MRLSSLTALAALLSAAALPLAAQTQQPRAPIAVYWMSVATAARTGFDVPAGMGGLLPPGMQGGKRMRLDLGTSLAPEGEARATHAVPPDLMLGEKLPLLTPKSDAAVAAPGVAPRERSQATQRSKGRMLVYWGCGETVRPGQPVVIDFAKLDGREAARAFRSVDIARPRGPAAGRQRSYGAWPNQESEQRIPEAASLRGLHFVSGSYTPDIQFSIDAKHDFMAPIEFMPMRRADGGGTIVNWKAVPTAIGYFATATGTGERDDDVATWSSSEVRETGQTLLDYVPPPEVERLVKDRIALAPQTNSCTVPAGIFKGGGATFNLIAYGDELNLLHPPRPKNPKEKWQPLWGVKVRLKSTATTLLAEGAGAKPSAEAAPSAQGNVLDEGRKALRGIFGR